MIREPNVTCGYCAKAFFKPLHKMKAKSGLYFCSREHQGFAFRKDSGVAVTSGPAKHPDSPDRSKMEWTCRHCSVIFLTAKGTGRSFCTLTCQTTYIAELTAKVCIGCEEDVDIKEYAKAAGTADGFATLCNGCVTKRWRVWYGQGEEKRSKNAERNKTYYQTEKGQYGSFLKRLKRYGLSEDRYFEMLEACGGKCEICKESDAIHIDHDHSTGFVRGLLCRNCNLGLGNFKDSIEGLERALKYLKQAAVSPPPDKRPEG